MLMRGATGPVLPSLRPSCSPFGVEERVHRVARLPRPRFRDGPSTPTPSACVPPQDFHQVEFFLTPVDARPMSPLSAPCVRLFLKTILPLPFFFFTPRRRMAFSLFFQWESKRTFAALSGAVTPHGRCPGHCHGLAKTGHFLILGLWPSGEGEPSFFFFFPTALDAPDPCTFSDLFWKRMTLGKF